MGSQNQILLLDGAMGTELDRRGVDISLPLWSARAIWEAPDVLRQIHIDNLNAGADAITTNTFRTTQRTFAKAGGKFDWREQTNRAVEIAVEARDVVGRADVKIYGSIAPLEDCYRPDLAPNHETCVREHDEMVSCLLQAGVDRILFETMTNQDEAIAAAEAADRNAPEKWMMCFAVKSDGPPGVLPSGAPLMDILPRLEHAAALGVNCVAAPRLESQIKLLRTITHGDMPLIAYGNTGLGDGHGNWTETDASDPQKYAEYAQSWIDAGATIIGGCCGTTPKTIAALRQLISART